MAKASSRVPGCSGPAISSTAIGAPSQTAAPITIEAINILPFSSAMNGQYRSGSARRPTSRGTRTAVMTPATINGAHVLMVSASWKASAVALVP